MVSVGQLCLYILLGSGPDSNALVAQPDSGRTGFASDHPGFGTLLFSRLGATGGSAEGMNSTPIRLVAHPTSGAKTSRA
jgi:hypothetical protein